MNKIILFVILCICSIYLIYKSNEVKYIESKLNSQKYVVLNKYDSNNAADLLAEISIRLKKLQNYLNINHKNKLSNNIDNRFNSNNISEGSPDTKYTSYTVNKGEKMVFCIRDKKTKKLHDINLMMYVSIHELSHVSCDTIGHGEEFTKNFKFLLEVAEKLKIYNPIPFGTKSIEYCGLKL